MKQFQLIITSKNKKSLKNFLNFIFKNSDKFTKLIKNFKINKKHRLLTILKSPHINKKAQEQFIFITFQIKLNFITQQQLKHLLLIKKIKDNVFLDVNIKIKLLINKNLSKKTEIRIFNPTNFKLNVSLVKHYYNKYYNFKKLQKFFKILDIYGEFCHKKI